MTTTDGNVSGTALVVNHGPPAQRWNLVILGDGYRQIELGQYASDVQNFVNTLQGTNPFNEVWNAINVYRIDVVSTDSGADDPISCGGSGATPKTYFDASFCNGGIQRLLVANGATAITVANQQVPEWDVIMVIVNSTIYGGSGGAIAVFSLAPGANEIGMHEMGHAAFGFADEYEYYAGCGSGEIGHDGYTGGEPPQPNVTIDTNRATNKWRDLILASTSMPTSSNSNCTECDSQPSTVPQGTVGAFEGAFYNHCGVYRPEFDCKMRALGFPFCSVCRRVIQQKLSPYLSQYENLPIISIIANGDDGNRPANAIDNNLSTRWSRNGVGSWIRADLGVQKTVSNVDIAWHSGNERQNNFVISVSNDGTTFTNVFTGKSSGTTLSPEKYDFPDITARYVKITVNGNTQNNWASITEIDVYGS